MLDHLVLWEREFFLWLNSPHTQYFDAFMYLISARWTWTGVVVALICWLFYKKRPAESLLLISFTLILMFCSDQVSSGIIKPICERLRPTYHPYTKELVKSVYHDLAAGFGFVSGHATNFFAIATFTACTFRDRYYTVFVYITATLIVYSRIYLGVHFISDVVPGMIIGTLIAWVIFELYRMTRRKIFCKTWKKSIEQKNASYPEEPYQIFRPTIACWNLIFTAFIFFLLFFSMDIAGIASRIGYMPM